MSNSMQAQAPLELLEEERLATARPGCGVRAPELMFTRGFSLLTSRDGLGSENFSQQKVKLLRTSR